MAASAAGAAGAGTAASAEDTSKSMAMAVLGGIEPLQLNSPRGNSTLLVQAPRG